MDEVEMYKLTLQLTARERKLIDQAERGAGGGGPERAIVQALEAVRDKETPYHVERIRTLENQRDKLYRELQWMIQDVHGLLVAPARDLAERRMDLARETLQDFRRQAEQEYTSDKQEWTDEARR